MLSTDAAICRFFFFFLVLSEELFLVILFSRIRYVIQQNPIQLGFKLTLLIGDPASVIYILLNLSNLLGSWWKAKSSKVLLLPMILFIILGCNLHQLHSHSTFTFLVSLLLSEVLVVYLVFFLLLCLYLFLFLLLLLFLLSIVFCFFFFF